MFELLLKVGDDVPKKPLRNGSWFSRSAFVRHSSSGGTNQRAEGTIQMENKQDKGFTLVELLIVIVILGILATVTVFAVRGITERSQENACDVELRALDTAVEAYYVDNEQVFPTSLAQLESGGYVKTVPEAGVWSVSGGGPNELVISAASGGKCAA